MIKPKQFTDECIKIREEEHVILMRYEITHYASKQTNRQKVGGHFAFLQKAIFNYYINNR